MLLSDRLGTLDTDISHLHTFVDTWYSDGDKIAIMGIAANGRRRVLSIPTTKEELLEMDEESMMSLCFLKEDSQRFNMYIGINPLVDKHEVTLHRRGKKTDIDRIIGTFADLDIKDGSFSTKNQAYNFINSLDMKPTMVVDNGKNGGVHMYHKVVEDDQKPYLVNEDTLKGWWSYLSSMTSAKIDKLTDSTRVARMPSSIYWGTESTDIVRVHTVNDIEYKADDINSIVKPYADAYDKRINDLYLQKTKYTREFNVYSDQDRSRLSSLLANDGVSMDPAYFVLKRAALEHIINTSMDWDDILVPKGWTYLKTQDDQSRVYARPGKSDRSAVVDYVDDMGEVSPVMSLLSSSEQTGLADLKEANIPLTKYQVLLRLWFEDNEGKMVESYSKSML